MTFGEPDFPCQSFGGPLAGPFGMALKAGPSTFEEAGIP
jgi:hypothetical protein